MIPLHDHQSFTKVPVVTIGLMVVSVGVCATQLSLSAERAASMFQTFGFIPARWLLVMQEGDFSAAGVACWPLVTNLFLHAGLFHLLTNLVYLWTFSRKVEDVVGRARFLVFYGMCGVGAVLAYTVWHPMSMIPLVGASSAISGVLGAYLALAPRARILLLMPGYGLVTVAAWLVLAGWFGVQVLMTVLGEGEGGGVGFSVHVAGFVIGLTLFYGWARLTQYPLGWAALQPRRAV